MYALVTATALFQNRSLRARMGLCLANLSLPEKEEGFEEVGSLFFFFFGGGGG